MKTTELTLRIIWDDTIGQDHPLTWDWASLLDLGPNETIEVVEETP